VPPELAPLPAVRKATRRLAGVAATVALAYPLVASPDQANTGSLFAIYGMVAVSLVVLIGWGGQISLGQWGLAAVGALVGGALTEKLHLPFPLPLLVAGVAGAGVAVLLGLPALRIRGLFLAVTTLGFSLVVSSVFLSDRYFEWLIAKSVDRPRIAFIDTSDARAFYYLSIAMLLLTVLAALGLRRSRTGRVLIAMRENERAAQAFGVNLVRTRLATFAISGFIAAVAGCLFAYHQHGVNQLAFQPYESINMFLISITGGLGSVIGVLLGPLYFALIAVVLPNFALLSSAVGVMVVLLLIPGGLGSLAYGLRDAYLRRVAIRNQIFVPSLLADYAADGEMSKVPLVPLRDDDGEKADLPVRYRLPSRIGIAGASQSKNGWSF
jgi:branched-chain amino acid transport system permease protein